MEEFEVYRDTEPDTMADSEAFYEYCTILNFEGDLLPWVGFDEILPAGHFRYYTMLPAAIVNKISPSGPPQTLKVSVELVGGGENMDENPTPAEEAEEGDQSEEASEEAETVEPANPDDVEPL